jgi:hypothetical protein
VFIKDYRALVLRRGDLHHVACRIRSSSSGDVHRVIGRIAIDLLSGRLAVKDRDKTPRITGVILIMWYQITGLITASVFC